MTQSKPSLLREFFRYASLNMLGMVGISCYILADTFFVAQGLGQTGLTALNLAIPCFNLIHGCGLMLGMGGAIRYSILKGQAPRQQTDRLFTALLALAAVLALIFLTAGIFFSRPLTRLTGADQEVFEMTRTYLQVLLLFSPAFLTNDLVLCFVRNDGAPQLATLAMVAGSFSNIVLDMVFIFGLGWGIFGAVFATGLAPLFSLAILSRHLLSRRRGFSLCAGRPRLRLALGCLGLGFPSLVTEFSSGTVIIAFNYLFLRLEGNVGVAAYGVVTNLSLVVTALFTGLAQGAQPLISRAQGQNRPDQARRLLRYGLFSVLGLSLFLYAITALAAGPIAAVFNSEGDPLLQEIAVQGLRLYFLGIGFAGWNILFSIFFAATEQALPAHLISLSRGLFLILPMAFLMAWLGGAQGVWLTYPLTELLTLAMAAVLYRKKGQATPTPSA
mgnify:CR=1 FL=1